MTLILVVLVALAGLSLGLRTTSVLMPADAHPLDRLALSILSGAMLTGVVLTASESYRVYDFGLGLMLSLSPAGMFDITKWWFRSRERRSGWLRAGGVATWQLVLRWLFLGFLTASLVAAVIRR